MDNYKEEGYFISESLFNEEFCQKILNYIKTLGIKLKIPFYNRGFGYGNLINDPFFTNLLDNSKFRNIINNLLDGDEYIINHLIINNKIKLVGDGVEWHQELFNVTSYAPGFDENDIDKLLQIYITLTNENIENGCLKIIPKSHKFGLLKHTDIINSHYSHKRAVDLDILENICKTHKIKNLELKSGSVVFFNNLLIHGSGTNKTNKNRTSIVIGIRKTLKPIDKSLMNNELKYRKKFIINYLKKRINDLENDILKIGVTAIDNNVNTTWKNIFEKIPWISKDNYINDKNLSIKDLLKIDGHSISKTGNFTMKKWFKFIDQIKENIEYIDNNNSKILEIGCGCGALLSSFKNNNIYGLDLSKNMIDIAKSTFPNGNFIVGEANNILYENELFDYILSHSCFQYFNSNDYFEKTIYEISRLIKKNGKISLTDIFDEENKEKNIYYRIQQIGEEEYNKLYKDLHHFYINKQKFIEILKKYNFDNIKIIDTGYDDENNINVSFRYNIYATKL